MGKEYDRVKWYFRITILFPIVAFLILKYIVEIPINLYIIIAIILMEITWYCIYKERLAHFKYILEKKKKEKSEPQYIISTKTIEKLPENVIKYTYKFVDYSIHDIYDKNSTTKQTIYRTDKKFCYVYYIEKGKLLEVKRKLDYERILKRSFARHENRGSYGDY